MPQGLCKSVEYFHVFPTSYLRRHKVPAVPERYLQKLEILFVTRNGRNIFSRQWCWNLLEVLGDPPTPFPTLQTYNFTALAPKSKYLAPKFKYLAPKFKYMAPRFKYLTQIQNTWIFVPPTTLLFVRENLLAPLICHPPSPPSVLIKIEMPTPRFMTWFFMSTIFPHLS